MEQPALNAVYENFLNNVINLQKKGGNVKTIPPYKPIPADNGSSDSSPEKEAETPIKSSSGKRKSSSSKSSSNSKSKSNASPSLEINGVADDNKSGSSGRNTPKDNSTSSSKFTTSNFVETIVTQSESVFGHDGSGTITTIATTATTSAIKTNAGNSNAAHKNVGSQGKSNSSTSNKTSSHTSKKRKTGARTPTVIGNENSNQSASSEASGSVVMTVSSMVQQQTVPSNNVQPTITEATSLSITTEPEKSKKVKFFHTSLNQFSTYPF